MNNQSNDKESETNETLLAVCFRVTTVDRMVGAAFINLHERKILITEFSDNEHFSGLESLVIQQNNSAIDSKFKVLLHLNSEALKDKIQDTLQMCEVDFGFSSDKDKKEWDAKHVQLSLDQLLKQSFSFMVEESKMELALSALNAAIEHMRLTSYGEAAQKKFTLAKYTLDEYLRLDVAALKALNVFPGTAMADVASASG